MGTRDGPGSNKGTTEKEEMLLGELKRIQESNLNSNAESANINEASSNKVSKVTCIFIKLQY